MSSPAEFHARVAGRAARAALGGGRTTVFAAFERSFYVETASGIACIGSPDLGRGPLNVIVDGFKGLSMGDAVLLDMHSTTTWRPPSPMAFQEIPDCEIPESVGRQGRAFLDWIGGAGRPDDALIGLGPGLTPVGDDFVGGAMIALRTFGEHALADRIAGWALPLARERTNRISRAHLECAAQGEGHEALHELLRALHKGKQAIDRALAALSRVGHSSGRDAAAGALLTLGLNISIA